MTKDDALFHTEVVNEYALDGEAYVKDGLRVLISDPLSQDPGSNPEELFGLAWSTCLNATIQALLKARGVNTRSRVEVVVDYKRESDGRGYYFDLTASAAIEGYDEDQTKKLFTNAHRRCPVSKIIGSYPHVFLNVMPFHS
ncbi:OsmC family protein [Jeotgalibaca sp. A127]